MATIRYLCDRILGYLEVLGYPISTFLQPGLSEQDIERVQRSLPFVFPGSILELYKWRNGTALVPRTFPGKCFFPGWCFDTITESLERYKVLSTPIPCDVELWRISWFPIFSASDISSIGICCSPSAQAQDGEVMCYEYTVGTRVAYCSLHSMLETVLAAYESGVIVVGNDGELDFDAKAFVDIARRLNPGVKRWIE
jgi:hypothetical protein